MTSTIKSRSRSGSYLGYPRSPVSSQRRKADTIRYHVALSDLETHADRNVSSLVAELDTYAQPGSVSLCTVANDDNLFLQHDSHLAGLTNSAEKFHNVLDLTTSLLSRLQARPGNSDIRQRNDAFRCGGLKCENFVANLEHILRCLKQLALDVIIRQYLNLVEAHILHWHHFWQQRRHLDEGWFAEWPNGQRPLSTTWPWNVKPSLLVLWGVCWMFYGSPGYNTNALRNTRNRRAAAPSQDFRTGPVLGQQSQPPPNQSANYATQLPRQQYDQTPNTSSEAWAGPASTPTYPNYSWLHPNQAGTRPTRANSNESESYASRSHGITSYDSTGALTIPVSALQTYSTSLAANPYIIGTPNLSSDLLPASQVTWPYCQGINPDPSPAYAPNYTPWQTTPSAYDPVGTFPPTPQRTHSGTGLQSYGQRRQVANPKATGGGVGSLIFGFGLQDMQNYPSPHSDVSHQTTSSTLSILPGAMTSPNMQFVASPSVAGSSLSGRSSRRSLEPPRNAEGMLYCDNPECARQPPLFSRKCEWTYVLLS